MKKIIFSVLYLLFKNLPSNLYINLLRGKVIGMYARGTKKRLQIGRSVNVANPQSLIFGDNVVINAEVYLVASASSISIGDNCLVAPRCFIQTLNHNYQSKEKLISEQGSESKPIVIGADCWLAYNSVVLPGVNVGEGGVVAAGAVVTKDTPPYSVCAGVPARKVKDRS